MSGIDKEDLALATAGFFKLGEQGGAVEFKLELRVGLSGNGASLANFHPQALHESARLAFTQADPGERFDAGDGLLSISYQSRFEGAFQTFEKWLQRTARAILPIFETAGEPAS